MLFCKDIEQKAVDTLCSYCKIGTRILSLIEEKNYLGIELILKKRDDLFSNFKKIELFLKQSGINIFENKDIIQSMLTGIEQNKLIENSSTEILNYYRSKLSQLTDSIKYIRKAQHSIYEHTLRKEV